MLFSFVIVWSCNVSALTGSNQASDEELITYDVPYEC
uniref:Uncharacterized protein n=1 Tax=Anguilla anguilla TaxID=7936 RepID=A0A0E9PTG4_ANGAN